MMPQKQQTTITLRQLLWLTRGKYWDYLFLCSPQAPERRSWIDAYRAVFRKTSLTETPVYAKGVLQNLSGSGEFPFVAAAMLDPKRMDHSGRPVEHYFIYLLENEGAIGLFSIDWPQHLLEALNPFYESIFELVTSETASSGGDRTTFLRQADLLKRFRRSAEPSVTLPSSGDARPHWENLGKISLADLPTQSSPVNHRVRNYEFIMAIFLSLILLLLGAVQLLCNDEDSSALDAAPEQMAQCVDLTIRSPSDAGPRNDGATRSALSGYIVPGPGGPVDAGGDAQPKDLPPRFPPDAGPQSADAERNTLCGQFSPGSVAQIDAGGGAQPRDLPPRFPPDAGPKNADGERNTMRGQFSSGSVAPIDARGGMQAKDQRGGHGLPTLSPSVLRTRPQSSTIHLAAP